ncbi:Cupredoxin [Colletotrichum zoysiae]|uniref:Cupredoxin n=1 Tax=Colletotrichum zoysiae TaxID=1216348 RepID=A0AAD9HT10_9PEZI|nr:Cupredoxin [Colletotrichum zoysiae]
MHASAILAAVLPAAAVMGATHVVKVGDGGLKFEPNNVKAAVGDKVEFHFYPKSHSVAQSAFDTPCTPLSNGTTTGFFSGPVPVASGVGDMVWTLDVKDKSPKWFYCATAMHCQGGMVGAINAPKGKTVEMFAAAAKDVKANVAPSSTSGGTLGPASASTSGTPASGSGAPASGSSGSPMSSMSSMPTSAGVESRGDVRWGMLSLGMAAAGLVGGLLI